MASVYGPLEAKIQKELSDRMYVEVNYKPKIGMPGKHFFLKIVYCVWPNDCYGKVLLNVERKNL